MRITGNRVRVAPIRIEKSNGGVWIPPMLQDDYNTGGVKGFMVVAVGPGRVTKKGVLIPIDLKPGERILCHSYFEGPVPMEDGSFLITPEQILAVLRDEPQEVAA